MLLPQDQLTELRKLLAALYPLERDQLRLASEAELTVGAIELGSSAFNNWHQILRHANHNQAISRLLELVQQEFPENAQLDRLAAGQPTRVPDGRGFDWRGPKNGRGLLEKLTSNSSSLVPVSHLALGLLRARAVAQVRLADGGTGTGFLVGGNRLVTNHHVLPNAAAAEQSLAVFNYQQNTQGLDEPIERFALDPSAYFASSEADDISIVAVRGAPCERWGSLELTPRSIAKGDVVNIVQHSGGGPKQMSLSFDGVAFVGEGRLQYLTRTLPGSSGAPVFDKDWHVVAVHHSGGWLMEPGSSEGRVYYRNQGILTERVLELLRSRDDA